MADVEGVDVGEAAEQLVHVELDVEVGQVALLLTAHLVEVVLEVLHYHV